jgi:hypothetical protein
LGVEYLYTTYRNNYPNIANFIKNQLHQALSKQPKEGMINALGIVLQIDN